MSEPVRFTPLTDRILLAAEQCMDGLSLHDSEGVFEFVNVSEAEMYGYTREELLGQTWRIQYSEEEQARLETVAFPALEKHGRWTGEVIGTRKSGEQFPVEIALTAVFHADGSSAGLVCNCRDLTQRRLTEASMQRLQRLDALGQLTGGVAHDFNNLLAVILGESEVALGDPSDAEAVQACLHQIQAAGSKAADLTRRLLAFARKQPLSTTVVDVCACLKDMDKMARRLFGSHLTVHTDITGLTRRARLDQGQLENALLNLAVNARDAMPTGGSLFFVARDHDLDAPEMNLPPGRYIRIEVRDTGTGIPAEILPRIFEPFFTTRSEGQGNGLGLSQVYGFARQSGGGVSVESPADGGARFILVLPATLDEMSVAESPDPECSTLQKKRLLLVEDDPLVRATVTAQLQQLGLVVTTAADAHLGLAQLEQASFDIVLSDIGLPGGLDGYAMVDAAGACSPALPCVLMTGAGASPQSKSVTVLYKPFQITDLQRVLVELLV